MMTRSLIVQRISRWLAPFIFIYGLQVILYGHLSPGGGFPGGVILASAFILILISRGKEEAGRRLPLSRAGRFDNTGALVFLAVGLLGFVLGGAFLANFLQRLFPGRPFSLLSSGTIPVNNLAIGLKIWGGIFLAVLFLSVLRVGGDPDRGLKTMEEE